MATYSSERKSPKYRAHVYDLVVAILAMRVAYEKVSRGAYVASRICHFSVASASADVSLKPLGTAYTARVQVSSIGGRGREGGGLCV